MKDLEKIQTFAFQNANIRTITMPEGEIYFVAQDVCKVLALTNVGQALSRLDEDEKTYIISNDVSMGTPKLTVVTESGFYSLVLSSKKSEAKAFTKWVTSEVLPTLRKTGKYELPKKSALAALMENTQAYMTAVEAAAAENGLLSFLQSDEGITLLYELSGLELDNLNVLLSLLHAYRESYEKGGAR